MGIVATGLVDFFEIEGADAVVAFAVVGGCPPVETCIDNATCSALHLLGTGDGGREKLGDGIAENGGLLFFSLKLEGEEEGLIHLLLADESAAVLTLISGLQLGGNGALDSVGGYVLGNVPAAGLARHCADVFLGIGDATVVHAPKWARGLAEVIAVGVYLIGHLTDCRGVLILIFHVFSLF